jgi:beta-lactamase regulating signal transducer with metallopeptidase domain
MMPESDAVADIVQRIGAGLVIVNWHAMLHTSILVGAACVVRLLPQFQTSPANRRKLWLCVMLAPIGTLLVCLLFGSDLRFTGWLRWAFLGQFSSLALGELPQSALAGLDWHAIPLAFLWCWMFYASGRLTAEISCSIFLVSHSEDRHPTELESLFNRLTREMNVGWARLRTSRYVRVPCVAGLRRPTVLVPERMALEKPFDEKKEWEAILRHELAHVRARDNWLLLFEQLIWTLCPLPTIWLVRRWLHRDIEEACDEVAMESGAITKLDFANMLLALVTSRSVSNLSPAINGLLSRQSALHHRFEAIAAFKPGNSDRQDPSKRNFLITAAILLTVGPLLSLSGSILARHGYGLAIFTEVVPTVSLLTSESPLSRSLSEDSGIDDIVFPRLGTRMPPQTENPNTDPLSNAPDAGSETETRLKQPEPIIYINRLE